MGERSFAMGFAATLLLGVVGHSATGQIFVTSYPEDRLEIADLDGRNHRIFLDLDRALFPADYRPLDLKVSGASLYWTDTEQGAIYSASLNGTNARKLIDIEQWAGRSSFPFGVAVTDSGLLWTEASTDQGLFRADLDGSNPRTLVPGSGGGGSGPLGYQPNAILASGSRVIWGGWTSDHFIHGAHGRILAANLNGSNPVALAEVNGVYVRGLALSGTRLYWTSMEHQDAPGPATIEVARIDGSGRRTIINLDTTFGPASEPWGIAATDSNLYWVDRYWGAVFTAGLDGSNPRKLFDTFGNSPEGIAIAPPPPPVHPFIITDLQTVPDAPPFQRTWRVTWNSQIGETYRVLLSDDLETWLPASGTWAADSYETSAEILLPANMPQAFFRVERE